MKLQVKALLLSLLVASSVVGNANGQVAEIIGMVAPTVAVVKDALDFCKKVFDISSENTNKFAELSGTLNQIADLSQTEITKYASEITVALKTASDRYDNMILGMRTMCVFNIDTKDNYYYFINSDMNHNDFSKEFLRRFRFLSSMVDRTLNETKVAKAEINLVHKEITSVSGKLVYIQETFNQLANQKKAEMQDKMIDEDVNIENAQWSFLFFHGQDDAAVNRATANKDALKKKVELLNKFIDDTKAYVEWLETSGNELKKAAQERGLDVADMMGTAESKKKLLGFLKSTKDDPDENPDEIRNYVFGAMDNAVKSITDLSVSFITKTSKANTIMNRPKRSFGFKYGNDSPRRPRYEEPQEERAPVITYKVVEKKVSIMIVFPVEKVLQMAKSTNETFPYLDEKTIQKASYVSIFFETGLDVLDNLRNVYETSSRDFIREIDQVARMRNQTVNTPEMHGNVAQLAEQWKDLVSELRRLGEEWRSYMNSNAEEFKSMPKSVRRKMYLDENRQPIKDYLDNKMDGVFNLLKGFNEGTLKNAGEYARLLNSAAGLGSNGQKNVYYNLETGSLAEAGLPAEQVAQKAVDYFLRLFRGLSA